jgi:hypothetical protein
MLTMTTGVALQQVDEAAVAVQLFTENIGWQAEAGQRDLDDGPNGHLAGAEEDGQPRHALAPDHRRIDRLPVRPDGNDRGDAARREVHELDLGIRRLELGRAGKGDRLEGRCDPSELLLRQCPEQHIVP